jgi:hypothetical protein
MEEDKHLDARHAIEEAMSKSLLSNLNLFYSRGFSSCAYEELSQVSERFVSPAGSYVYDSI